MSIALALQEVREFVIGGKIILAPNRFAYLISEHFGSLIRSRSVTDLVMPRHCPACRPSPLAAKSDWL